MTYLVQAPARDIEARAEALMLEQAVELPREALLDRWVTDRIVGRVETVRPEAEGRFRVTIAHPLATTANDPAQLLNVLFGNSSLQPDVVLADVELPEAAFDWLPGPRVGVPGLRDLTGVARRPLVATALKPMGLRPDQLAALCRTFASAGLDVIKDDHGLADHPFCPFEMRVEACLGAIEDSAQSTGRRALYVPNLTGTPERVVRQLAFAREAGVRAVMLAPMLVGLPLLHQLASTADGLPILAHPSLGGVLRAAEATLFGKLFRWYGADAVIFPHAGGRFSFSRETCRSLAAALREAHPRARPAFPVPGGGMSVDRVAELLSFYGPECILLLGSGLYKAGLYQAGLYQAGDALFDRTRALVDQVARTMREEQMP
ncbi:MAG: RuBisCO large subunit C-terminal-like domain-containing protein [Gemmatimonadales bacterium]